MTTLNRVAHRPANAFHNWRDPADPEPDKSRDIRQSLTLQQLRAYEDSPGPAPPAVKAPPKPVDGSIPEDYVYRGSSTFPSYATDTEQLELYDYSTAAGLVEVKVFANEEPIAYNLRDIPDPSDPEQFPAVTIDEVKGLHFSHDVPWSEDPNVTIRILNNRLTIDPPGPRI